MSDPPLPPSAASKQPHGGARLDSWKEIAAYMRRDVKTVQRWEKRERMPVHRHQHDKLGSVYAFESELDAWAERRRLPAPVGPVSSAGEAGFEGARVGLARPPQFRTDGPGNPAARRRTPAWLPMAALLLLPTVALVAYLYQPGSEPADPLAGARFQRLTDFPGIERGAAISRDGRLAAFLSDRDGQMDIWLTQVGSGFFQNLTHGSVPGLVNPSLRALAFSPDGGEVRFWSRRPAEPRDTGISVGAVPVLGDGAPRIYLDAVAEYDVAGDGTLAYHTPDPGDPLFVRREGAAPGPPIFSAPTGLHAHFPRWSRDGAFIYFVQGAVDERMDIWRVGRGGGSPERVTTHDAAVSFPVFLDARRLLYLATDADGGGPWIYSLDVARPSPRRVSQGLAHFTSLDASADGRRIVATLAAPRSTLWRIPIGARPATTADAEPVPLRTGTGSAPRLGAGFLFYVADKGTDTGIWKVQGDRPQEVWSSPGARIVGAPAVAPGGERIAFSARGRDGAIHLWIANSDGTGVRNLPTPADIEGAPAWTPDGGAVTVATIVRGTPCLFRVPVDGRPAVQLTSEHAVDPAWSPGGDFVVYSGADVGTTFPVRSLNADGSPRTLPALRLTRGARRVVLLNGGRTLVVMKGDLRHKDLWAVDLRTGQEQQLTAFAPGFDIRDFDVTPDGRTLVVEQVEELSDIVLIERSEARPS